MIKLTDILNEMRINKPTGLMTSKDIEALETLTYAFGEGDSGFDLHNPMSETYKLEDYEDLDEDDKSLLAIQHLLNKQSQTYVVKDIFGTIDDAPGAPNGAFYIAVKIDRENRKITVYSPYISEDW